MVWRPVSMPKNPSETILTGRVLKMKIEARIGETRPVIMGLHAHIIVATSGCERIRRRMFAHKSQHLPPLLARPPDHHERWWGMEAMNHLQKKYREVVPPAGQPPLGLHLSWWPGFFSHLRSLLCFIGMSLPAPSDPYVPEKNIDIFVDHYLSVYSVSLVVPCHVRLVSAHLKPSPY